MNYQAELLEHETENYSSPTFPTPRDFQVSAHEKLREGARNGHRKQVVMAPTGAGKSYLAMRVIQEALVKGRSAMFVCDRTTLINQTSAVADKYGLSAHGIIQADHWRVNKRSKFQIASCQTLARRGWPEADVLVIDECHSQYKTWVEHVTSENCKAHVIGLSATPFASGLGKIFTNLVNAATMDELTRSGVLVPMRVFSCTKIDMRGAETIGGEWSDGAAAERGMDIIGDVVTEWSKFAADRKTIIFGATIAHCEEMARQFNEAGVMAACFTSDTKPEEREALLKEYRKPDSVLRVLISVEALAKGFDVPDVACICDCRSLRKSLSTAIQMWGRGLRSSPAKSDCVLLDFSGNIVRFADDYADIFYNGLDALDMGEKLDKTIRKDDEEKTEGKACPKCGYKPCGKRCVSCGHEHVSTNLIEHLPGQMSEFKVGKQSVGDKLSVWEQSVTLCRNYGKPDTADKRAAHLYRSITGVWPRGMPDFDKVKSVTISQAVQNKHRANMIAFSKSKKAA